MTPGLSDMLVTDLRRILRPRRLTTDLAREFAEALARYEGRSRAAASRVQQQQRRDAVRRLRTAAATLQREIRRADAVFAIRAPLFLPSTWAPLGPTLQTTIAALDRWMTRHAARPRRGRPDDGQGAFRVCVLGALHDAGVPIGSATGPAGRVLSRLLAELDRCDGIPPRARRVDVSGTQWARWVHELRTVDAAIADRNRVANSPAFVN